MLKVLEDNNNCPDFLSSHFILTTKKTMIETTAAPAFYNGRQPAIWRAAITTANHCSIHSHVLAELNFLVRLMSIGVFVSSREYLSMDASTQQDSAKKRTGRADRSPPCHFSTLKGSVDIPGMFQKLSCG